MSYLSALPLILDKTSNMNTRHLVILFLDQLSETLSALSGFDSSRDTVLMIEADDLFCNVPHHRLKIAFQIAAARQFAASLAESGYRVRYSRLEDADNTQIWQHEAVRLCNDITPEKIIVTEPSEWRSHQAVLSLRELCSFPVEMRQDTRFFSTKEGFSSFASSRKVLKMEHFYQRQRKEHGVLMDGNKPIGGKWNYDSDNRRSLPADTIIPPTTRFKADRTTQSIVRLVNQRYPDHPGSDFPFYFAVTRKDALTLLEEFIQTRLACFGDYQDAMAFDQPWLFHSHLSFYLNNGLLLPKEAVSMAEQAYDQSMAPLNAVEGFIRQIMGWREYVRGIYWHKMPSYREENYFNMNRSLPALYWHGNTKMACMAQCVGDTLQHAYAHHIQRLMVLGNFALLTECDPAAVQDWYLAVYADAYEWVELPNVVGMILHADGGYLASKPYVSSGNYINKMSNYCGCCHYQVKEKSGDKACPFNYLYWHFLLTQKDRLSSNPRLVFPYRTLAKMSKEKLDQIKKDSETFLENIDDA